jgi:hypothetical protein
MDMDYFKAIISELSVSFKTNNLISTKTSNLLRSIVLLVVS